jgi:hypothetical protein
MFVCLRVQGFESSVNKVFQKEKLVKNKKNKEYTVLYKEVSSAGAKRVQFIVKIDLECVACGVQHWQQQALVSCSKQLGSTHNLQVFACH